MDLSQLAFACKIYRRFADDETVAAIKVKVDADPSLGRHETALAVLKWLNSWGCRLCEADFPLAADELRRWCGDFGLKLPRVGVALLDLGDDDLYCAAEAYGDLFNRKAGRKRRFQATAASKVLFFLRPNSLPPWDEKIRSELGLDGSSSSYLAFLQRAQGELRELNYSCEATGIDIANVPNEVHRPASTLAKLVDEYNWVTITRGFRPPDWLALSEWLAWSLAGKPCPDALPKSLPGELLRVVNDPSRIRIDPDALWELREASKI